MRRPELANAFIEAGRIVERAHNSGLWRDPEMMLAGLALAAQAEREDVAIHYAAQFVDVDEHGKVADEREVKRRCQEATRALATLRDWIQAA